MKGEKVMNKLLKRIVFVALAFLFPAMGCALGATPQPATRAPEKPSVAPARAAWQDEWDKTVAAAKKELKVSVQSRWPPALRDSMTAAFKEKYGLEIDNTGGQLGELWPKMEAERRTGMYLWDIVMDGATSLGTAVSAGAAAPMEQAFILPEVRDGTLWRDGRLPFYDKEGRIFMYISRVQTNLLINTEIVKPEEFKSWRSLLDPKWKGKILLNDPSIPGPGGGLITTLGMIMGIDYLRELAKQDPIINRDMRLQVEWVAKAKYPVAMGFDFTVMEEMRGAGAPLLHVVPAEGSFVGSGFGSMVMFDPPAHPNATKVFLNWFLSKEGQTLFARIAKDQSRRADVPSGLAPDRLLEAGKKYVDFDTEEHAQKRVEMYSLSKEIFGIK